MGALNLGGRKLSARITDLLSGELLSTSIELQLFSRKTIALSGKIARMDWNSAQLRGAAALSDPHPPSTKSYRVHLNQKTGIISYLSRYTRMKQLQQNIT